MYIIYKKTLTKRQFNLNSGYFFRNVLAEKNGIFPNVWHLLFLLLTHLNVQMEKKNPWKKNLRLRRRWHKWKLHLASLFGSTEAVLPPRFRRPDFVGFQGCRKLEFLLSSCRCFPWGWRFLGNSQENSPYKTHCIFVPLFFWVSRSFSFQKAAWQVILKRKKPKQILDSQLVSPPHKVKKRTLQHEG